MDGALMWGGDTGTTGGNGITAGGGGGGGREMSFTDWSLPPKVLVLLFTGGGGSTGSTGDRTRMGKERRKIVHHC